MFIRASNSYMGQRFDTELKWETKHGHHIITSEMVPGLFLCHPDLSKVYNQIVPVTELLLNYNKPPGKWKVELICH